MTGSNWTGRTARTLSEALGCDGHCIEAYRPPLHRRIAYGLMRHGWLVVVAVMLGVVLSGCDEMDSQERTAANLRDALATAQAKRPDLWTPERRARAHVAAGLVAKGVRE